MPVYSPTREPQEGEPDARLTKEFGYPVWSRVQFAGCVIADRERNGYNDSDFYAICWDEALPGLTTVEYASTRFSCIGCGCRVDATKEVIAKAIAWASKWALLIVTEAAERDSKEVKEHRRVIVARGRKVPIGTEGVVVRLWKGQWGWRALLEVREGDIWVSVGNLEVIDPEQYLPTADALKETAARHGQDAWHLPSGM